MSDELEKAKWLRRSLRGSPLFEHLDLCGEVRATANGAYRFRCGLPACVWCRRRYAHWRAEGLATRFAAASPDRMISFVIQAPWTPNLEAIYVGYRQLRQSIRNAARGRLWKGLRAYGTLAPEPVAAERVSSCSPSWMPEQPVWRPTLYGFAELPLQLHAGEFKFAIDACGRSGFCVRAATFDPAEDVGGQVAAQVRRPLARIAATPITSPEGGPSSFEWPTNWATAYYAGLHQVGGGFRTTTFQRGLRGPREPVGPEATLAEIEPLPILIDHENFGFNWW